MWRSSGRPIAVSLAGATGIPEGGGAILTVRFAVAAGAPPEAESLLRLTHARLIDARALPLPTGEMTEGRFRIAAQFPSGTAHVALNSLSADQGMREKGGVGPNAELPVQIFARDLPDVKGYTLTLEFDPEEITFARFEVGDFVPGLLVLPPQGSGGTVEVGGTSLTGGSNSGNGPIYFADFFLFADLFTRLNRTGD